MAFNELVTCGLLIVTTRTSYPLAVWVLQQQNILFKSPMYVTCLSSQSLSLPLICKTRCGNYFPVCFSVCEV
jgi:hypothetical protein